MGEGVFVSKNCHNKFPQTLRAKRELSSPTVLEGSSLKSVVASLSELLEAAGSRECPWACSCVILVSARWPCGAAPPVCFVSSFPSSSAGASHWVRGHSQYWRGFPGDSDGKEFSCSAEHPGSIPERRSSLAGGHGNPRQYPCLENSMNRGAWRATVHGVAMSWT